MFVAGQKKLVIPDLIRNPETEKSPVIPGRDQESRTLQPKCRESLPKRLPWFRVARVICKSHFLCDRTTACSTIALFVELK